VGGDSTVLAAALKRLAEVAEKPLATYRKHSKVDFLSGFVKAIFVALLIRTLIVEPFKIPSGSMIPTLEIGDQIFVNKFIYGVRIPFINKVPFVLVRAPKRGDVIVFNNPVDTSKDFIKRVAGIPGDTIEIQNEVLYVNGQPQPRVLKAETYVYKNLVNDEWVDEEARAYEETLGDRPHTVLQDPFSAGFDGGPWTVPEGHVFVLGDNRESSSDSRVGFGKGMGVEYVPFGNIKGKAMVIWLSLSYGGRFAIDGTGLRTDRLFLPVR
jgi:signal peptidase I